MFVKKNKSISITRIIIKRFLITIAIILFIRIGSFIPIPGVNLIDLALFIEKDSATTNLASLFSGKGTFKIGLFTLSIVPYINASILTQILVKSVPSLSKLQKEGDLYSKRAINRLTRFIALIVALFQSISLGLYLKPILFDWNIGLLLEIAISLTTGGMIVLWLSEVITEYGLGNGPSMVVLTNILLTYENINKGLIKETENNLPISSILINCSVYVCTSCIIAKLQEGIRRVPIISSKQLRLEPGVSAVAENYIPFRVNEAGVLPIILTTSILVLPSYFNKIGISLDIFSQLNLPYIDEFLKIIYWLFYFIFIIIFSLFYTQIALNSKDLADQLKKMAVALPGLRPGNQTAFFLKKLIERLTFIGSFLLAIIATVPNIIAILFGISDFSGVGISSLIIITGIIIDLEREIDDIIFSNIYLA